MKLNHALYIKDVNEKATIKEVISKLLDLALITCSEKEKLKDYDMSMFLSMLDYFPPWKEQLLVENPDLGGST